jgi:uncharacterized membrane protein YuzA (DUF378 family)
MTVDEIDLKTVVYGVSHVGAVTWGTQQFANFNVVTEFLSSPELAYGAIGAAGVVSLAQMFTDTDILGSD